MYFDLNKLKNTTPYVVPILIFLGFLRMDLYYWAFNIQISRFLEFSEILTAFLDDILFITGMFLFGFLFDVFTTSKKEVEVRQKIDDESLVEKSILKRLGSWMKFYLPFVIPLNLSIFAMIIIYYIVIHSFLLLLWVVLFWANIVPIVGFIVTEIRRTFFLITNTIITKTAFNLTFLIFLLVIMVLQRIQFEVINVKQYKRYYGVSFMIDSVLIKSDNLHYYIGQTKNYLFFYNQDSSRTSVYPMSRVKFISFR